MDNAKKIFAEIRKIMLIRQISSAQIARQYGISNQVVSNKLRRPNVNVKQLEELAGWIDCDIQINFIDRKTGDIIGSVTIDNKTDTTKKGRG